MKRQRTTADEVDVTNLTFQDVWRFFSLHDNPLTADELVAVGKQIDKLYSKKANLVIQNLPPELLLQIFDATSRLIRPHTTIPEEIFSYEDKKNMKFWLGCRTVSKSWKSALSKMRFEETFSDYLCMDILSFFHFSNLRIFRHVTSFQQLFDLTLLTEAKHIDFVVENPLSPHEAHLVSQFTNLSGLRIGGESITQESILALTNLTRLEMFMVPQITTLRTLTNLKTLALNSSFSLDQHHLQELPNLIDFETNESEFFQSGRGKLRNGGYLYDGEWEDGRRHGKGMYEQTLISHPYRYEGDFVEDRRHGKGVYRYWSNSLGDWSKAYYSGDWDDGERTGQGIRVYKNGDVYEGGWDGGWRMGQGKYTWKDGTVYEGHWQCDSIFGKGKCVFPNGEIYEGDWMEDPEEIGGGASVFACLERQMEAVLKPVTSPEPSEESDTD